MKINVFLTWQPQWFWKLDTSFPHVYKIQLQPIWGWQSCILRGIMSPVSDVVTTPRMQNKSFVLYSFPASPWLRGGQWPHPGTAPGKPRERPRGPWHAWVPRIPVMGQGGPSSLSRGRAGLGERWHLSDLGLKQSRGRGIGNCSEIPIL